MRQLQAAKSASRTISAAQHQLGATAESSSMAVVSGAPSVASTVVAQQVALGAQALAVAQADAAVVAPLAVAASEPEVAVAAASQAPDVWASSWATPVEAEVATAASAAQEVMMKMLTLHAGLHLDVEVLQAPDHSGDEPQAPSDLPPAPCRVANH